MARYTQRLIMSTFEQMLTEMPFDKITVSSLVKRCDISPNTFYYHYQDIYALLNAFLESRFGQYTQCDYLAEKGWRAATDARLHEIAGICRYAFLGFFLKFLWNRMDDNIDKSVDSLGELLAGFVENAVGLPAK